MTKWMCEYHKCPVLGEPFFIHALGSVSDPEYAYSWELDMSDMHCSHFDSALFSSDAAMDAELEACDWYEYYMNVYDENDQWKRVEEPA